MLQSMGVAKSQTRLSDLTTTKQRALLGPPDLVIYRNCEIIHWWCSNLLNLC